MKVILLQDIKSVGKKGQLIDAADGYARNYLIPRKMAVEATKGNVNELESKNKALVAKA
jgi:large subunit ribosomal protein L9